MLKKTYHKFLQLGGVPRVHATLTKMTDNIRVEADHPSHCFTDIANSLAGMVDRICSKDRENKLDGDVAWQV